MKYYPAHFEGDFDTVRAALFSVVGDDQVVELAIANARANGTAEVSLPITGSPYTALVSPNGTGRYALWRCFHEELASTPEEVREFIAVLGSKHPGTYAIFQWLPPASSARH